MSKIAKLIAKALNNSNSNEAAQSLKMAASYMQSEGVNPSVYLQHKGEQQEQPKDGSISIEELREAKRLAVYWHSKVKGLEEDLEAVRSHAQYWNSFAVINGDKTTVLRKWVKGLGVATLVLGVFSAVFIYVNQDLQSQRNNLLYQNSELVKENNVLTDKLLHPPVKHEVAPAPVAVPTVNHEYVTCRIQGLKVDTTKPGSKPKHIKFWFKDGEVSLYANNKLDKTEFSTMTKDVFLKEVNKAFPGESDCKLGVLN